MLDQIDNQKGIEILQSSGAKIIGFASDGQICKDWSDDMTGKLGVKNTVPDFLTFIFDADLTCQTPYFQDMDHISNKGALDLQVSIFCKFT